MTWENVNEIAKNSVEVEKKKRKQKTTQCKTFNTYVKRMCGFEMVKNRLHSDRHRRHTHCWPLSMYIAHSTHNHCQAVEL